MFDLMWELGILKACRLRATPIRLRVLHLFNNLDKGTHIGIDAIAAGLEKYGQRKSPGSIYRTLKEFEDSDLLIKHQFEGVGTVYELATDQIHGHIVCLHCNKIDEYRDDRMDILRQELVGSLGAELINHTHNIYVVCKECRSSSV